MVFHHILEDTQRAMNECLRVLRRGGLMVFSEGVPPSEHVKPFYIEMFRLKEDRLTFMEGDLEALLLNAGFHVRGKTVHWSRRSSIRNWLQNSGLPKTVQERIFRMHLDLDERGKKDYHMVVSDNDCFIDMKFCIYLGEKE
jgi:ubiquinone/menaquinone biosynthesis C-methylase UbiE